MLPWTSATGLIVVLKNKSIGELLREFAQQNAQDKMNATS